ncbi:hypothetical protein CDD80_1689 [Ophiocordyceps camponoti-rufipedis]|uniref:Uncharacterized protein n=1 Tax=Ophiocordyceps camponoti-rufipedis TaxID=2004952 RepID=A0A2C5Z8Y5_9HYPO|nr:hypothetical protein CDD80_1689 [Ophiocordyceps camponoti-rufipedis]
MRPSDLDTSENPYSATNGKIDDVYGPGSFTDRGFTPLPQECQRLLKLMADMTPGFSSDNLDVDFYGNDLPLIAGPLKSQAMSAVLFAMIGLVGREISKLKGIDTGRVHIDVDKAGLFLATPAIVSIDGKTLREAKRDGTVYKVGCNVDQGLIEKNPLTLRSWAIYPTKDGKSYQAMSSLTPPSWFSAYNLSQDAPVQSKDEAYRVIGQQMLQFSASELDVFNMERGFCGQQCYTPAEWRETNMGKSLARHPVLEYKQVYSSRLLPPVPFPESSDQRPLAGIRVIEIGRIIAIPALGATLSSLGAEVIKVQSPNLPDLLSLSVQLTADKQTLPLDLRVTEDVIKLRNLIADADVIIQGFRPGSLGRRGFGLENVINMANNRGKGIVYLDLSTYGPDGYYHERPGFQQIADAASGCSWVMGRSLGRKDCVLPSLPIADMLSGTAGAIDVMLALRDRAKRGGSYHASVALTSLDTVQLREDVGLYPPEIVDQIQQKWQFDPLTPDLHVEEFLALVSKAWARRGAVKKEYKQSYVTPWSKDHVILSPIVEYDNQGSSARWLRGPVPFCWNPDAAWTPRRG